MSLPKLSDDEMETLRTWDWQVGENQITGKYQAKQGNWDGMIEWRGSWDFYILDCPPEVLKGEQGSCFRGRQSREGRSVHWVHFHSGSPIPSEGIVSINQAIRYAFEQSPNSMSSL